MYTKDNKIKDKEKELTKKIIDAEKQLENSRIKYKKLCNNKAKVEYKKISSNNYFKKVDKDLKTIDYYKKISKKGDYIKVFGFTIYKIKRFWEFLPCIETIRIDYFNTYNIISEKEFYNTFRKINKKYSNIINEENLRKLK